MHCQDVSSFGNAPVKMCRLSAVGPCVCVFFLFISALNALSRCVVFRQCTCQDVSSFGRGSCVCVFFLFISALNALSRCVVFRQCTCQDVSSFGRGSCVCVLSFYFCPKCIVKMCRLSAGGLVCVFFLFISALNALSRCVVFRQCTCQDVVFRQGVLCVCVLSFYFCPKCTVKMYRLSAGGLVCVCVCVCVCTHISVYVCYTKKAI